MEPFNLSIRTKPTEQDYNRQVTPNLTSHSADSSAGSENNIQSVRFSEEAEPSVNSFTPINADTIHSCSDPTHMAHRLCNTDLTNEAVAISGPDVRPPIWIESLHVVDSELFHYIEYQLLHMRQSSEQILSFLQSHGVHISQQTMFDLIEQIIQLANLLIDHLSTPGSEPINGTDEVDRAIRRLGRGVGMHMPEEGLAHMGDARQAIQSLSSALSRLAMGNLDLPE